MEPLRVGLIGCGYISQQHLEGWELVQGARVVALCDRVEERLARRAHQFGIESTYADAEAMLTRANLDVMDICTRPESHLALVELAAAHGAHILCQKPLAPSLEEARRIVAAAEDRGVRLMVKENWRWFRWYQESRRILDAGTLGAVRRLRIYRRSLYRVLPEPAPDEEPTQYYFREMPRLVVYEFGIHLIDVVRFLLGEAGAVYAQLARLNARLAGEDVATLVLHYPEAHAVIEVNWADPFEGKEEGMAVDGEEAQLRLVAGSHLEVRGGEEGARLDYREYPESWAQYSGESHYLAQQHFTDTLRRDEPFATGGRDNLRTLEVTFGAYASAAENRLLPLSGAAERDGA